MKVILYEDIRSLGKKGDIVEVSDGYGRNFIIPRKKGVEATPANLNALRQQQLHDAKLAAQHLEAAQVLAASLERKSVTLPVKVGAGGKLFGAIASKDIAEAVKKTYNIELDKKKIQLDEPIKAVGEYKVGIKLHKDVTTQLTVNVVEG